MKCMQKQVAVTASEAKYRHLSAATEKTHENEDSWLVSKLRSEPRTSKIRNRSANY
jgi:hypothetical protein